MLKVTEIGKEYEDKVALFDVSLIFPDKGLVIIKGESGSGKTTLLNLLTAHDYPTMGCIEFDGVEINSKNRENYRKEHCSNIYQDYMLIEDMSVGENIELALQAYGESYTIELTKQLLQKVGLSEEYMTKQASKLSGGEKQRVSIARAIAKRGSMVFADEPTGNLDSQNGEKIMDLLKDISQDRLVVIVSHNETFNVKYADYTVELVDGVVEHCDLPTEIEESKKTAKSFERKSKLKAKSFIRLAFWGFKNNKAKTVVSIVAFVVISILTVVFAALGFGDFNLAYSHSLDKCQSKNLIAGFDQGRPVENITNDSINKFRERLSHEFAEVYATYYDFHLGKEDEEVRDKYYKKYHYTPHAGWEMLYNQNIGVDLEVLCGDFPKEYNEVMLPFCYAQYIADVYVDYKTDDVKNLIGKTIKYGERDETSIDLTICGIFDEGLNFTDFDKLQAKEVQFFDDTNKLARCAIFSQKIKEIWSNDALGSNMYILSSDLFVKDTMLSGFYGYDVYRDYAKEYPPLAYEEVYISRYLAEMENLSVGDTLSIRYVTYRDNNSINSTFDGMLVKGILDLTDNNEEFIVFSTSFYNDNFIKDKQLDRLKGFYFNLKEIGDVYGFLRELKEVGLEEKIWWKHGVFSEIYSAYTENINVTQKFYVGIDVYRYFIFIPLMVISLICLTAMGFVSTSYLVSSKGNSYNILRSLGFGKKNIALVLTAQVFAIIAGGCVLGISFGALVCHLFGRMYLKSKLGIAAKLATEVILPMGYIAPIIITVVSVLIGIIIVAAKTKSLFGKSIAENKQSE